MTDFPHPSTPFHTFSAKVWNPLSHHHHTTPLRGVGVWCGAGGDGVEALSAPHLFHTQGS